MEYYCDPNEPVPPVDRGYVVSMVVASFRGRQDVEVHLFKPDWDEGLARSFEWQNLLGDPIRTDREIDPEGSRKVLLESFTAAERNALVEYLRERYAEKLTSLSTSVMDFPIPMGLVPLSEIPETATIGKIHLEAVPNFSLGFPVHGIYDLSRHKPVDQK